MKILLPLLALPALALAPFSRAADVSYTGDVTDVRVIRHMDKHPGAALLWEPYIAQWKDKQLAAALNPSRIRSQYNFALATLGIKGTF